MNLGKSLIVLILLFSVLGLFTFAESLAVVSAETTTTTDNTNLNTNTWVSGQSYVFLTDLWVTVTVCIKNTKDHVQYFKISQTYYGSFVNGSITWDVIQPTNPTPEAMIDKSNNNTTGPDLGWSIQPGETKTVTFTLKANDFMGTKPGWIGNAGAVSNTYWPLVPDLGLYATWFQPNEIETLNPDLDLISWKGDFHFSATNLGTADTVHGIIRAPIVPTDSMCTFTDPAATFLDRDMTLNAQVAAWDGSFAQNVVHSYEYVYKWPIAAGSSSTGSGSNNLFPVTSANNTTTVPTQTTGVPYGLFAIAILIVGAGLGYAKFLR